MLLGMVARGLGRSLLKGRKKKVSTEKLMNRNGKGRGGQSVKKEEKGGVLAVRPSMGLVPDAKDLSPVSKSTGDSDIVIIKKQVIQVRDILKDTQSAKQKERVSRRKALQEEKRKAREEKIEKPKVKPKESKSGLKTPKIEGLGIGNWLQWVAFGVILNKLLALLPALKKIFNIIRPIAKFILGVLEKAIGFVVGFIDLAYAGVENLEKLIVAIGGEGAGELFNKFGKLFTQVINGALIAALIGARVGLFKKPKGPKGPKGPKPKWQKNLKKWWKKTPVGKFIRNQKAGWKRFTRKISRGPIGKTLKALRPKNVGKFIMEGGIDKALKGGVKNVGKIAPKVLKTATRLGKTAVKTVTPAINAVTKGVKTAVKTVTPAVKSTTKTATKTATKLTKNLSKTATTAAKTATKSATKLGKTGLKTGLKALKSAKKIISPIVKKIPFIGALIDFALNYFVFKEPLGKSAFMAIGAGVGAWLGGMLGTLIPVPFVGTAIGAFIGGAGGDMLAGAIYDAIFKEKELKKEDGEDKEMKEERTLVNSEDIISNNTQRKADGLDTRPSYGSDGMMIIENTTTYIQPIEV